MRTLAPPGSPAVTVIYIRDLMDPADLERLVLTPLSHGAVAGAPADLARIGRFPAPTVQVAEEAGALRDGLYAGLAAIHIDGHATALLVGSPQTIRPFSAFDAGTDHNVAVLYRHLPSPDLRVERLTGNRTAVVYLQSKAPAPVVRAVAAWAGQLGPQPPQMPWWKAVIGVLRLPAAQECAVPAALAAALEHGYVAVLTDHRSVPMVAPATIELLLSSAKDLNLPPAVRWLAVRARVLAFFWGLELGALLIAITAYHHSLVPGPFLVAMAATRQNAPLPISLEIFLASVLADAAQAAAYRLGGPRFLFLAWIATVLTIMGMMQVGVIGAISGITSIAAMIARDVLPNLALARVLRVWRYLFMMAGAGLGVYGLTLLTYAMLVYLGEEQICENPIRMSPRAVTR